VGWVACRAQGNISRWRVHFPRYLATTQPQIGGALRLDCRRVKCGGGVATAFDVARAEGEGRKKGTYLKRAKRAEVWRLLFLAFLPLCCKSFCLGDLAQVRGWLRVVL
jgi:hypothetical protein